jgi:hypothetical protein
MFETRSILGNEQARNLYLSVFMLVASNQIGQVPKDVKMQDRRFAQARVFMP